MKTRLNSAMLIPLIFLAGCEEESAPEPESAATGGKVAGEVLGGTITDDMLPLEELTSTSPPAEPTVTTITQTRSRDGDETTVETTVESTTGEDGPPPPPPPAPPEQPTVPEE